MFINRPKSEMKGKIIAKLTKNNAINQQKQTKRKNVSNTINLSIKEDCFISGQDSLISSSPMNLINNNILSYQNSPKNMLIPQSINNKVLSYQNSPKNMLIPQSKFAQNKINFDNYDDNNISNQYDNNMLNLNHNYFSENKVDEDKNYLIKQPIQTEFVSHEINKKNPSTKNCFIKNKYKFLLENYNKNSITITSNEI